MKSADILVDAYSRIRDVVHAAVDGLSIDDLTFRPSAESNSIGWLVWHLTRVQDDHIAEVAGLEQVWTAQGWRERFELPFDAAATGYAQSSTEVAAVQASAQLLGDYHDAVFSQSVRYLQSLADSDLDQVVDEAWDPPVTLGVRLISVISDDLQHVGQAAYLRGLSSRK